MVQLNHHAGQVELWVSQKLEGRSKDEVIEAFQKAFQRIWDKAELTLGHVTMHAIADRIVHVGREEYPWLSSLQKNQDGIDVTGLTQNASLLLDNDLRQGLTFILAEFLRVLGSLTAEIISSKLHASLMDETEGRDPKNGSKKKDGYSPVAKGGKK